MSYLEETQEDRAPGKFRWEGTSVVPGMVAISTRWCTGNFLLSGFTVVTMLQGFYHRSILWLRKLWLSKTPVTFPRSHGYSCARIHQVCFRPSDYSILMGPAACVQKLGAPWHASNGSEHLASPSCFAMDPRESHMDA